MTRHEKLSRRRYYGLLWFLVGFTVWQGSRIAEGLWPSLDAAALDAVVAGVSLVGWGLFTYYLIRVLLTKRRLSDAERRRMNDERVRQSRRTSFVVGFWAMLATTGLLLVAPGLPPTVVANLVIFVGVGASAGAFLYVEAPGAPSAPNAPGTEVAYE
jgi:hypothetical protein